MQIMFDSNDLNEVRQVSWLVRRILDEYKDTSPLSLIPAEDPVPSVEWWVRMVAGAMGNSLKSFLLSALVAYKPPITFDMIAWATVTNLPYGVARAKYAKLAAILNRHPAVSLISVIQGRLHTYSFDSEVYPIMKAHLQNVNV